MNRLFGFLLALSLTSAGSAAPLMLSPKVIRLGDRVHALIAPVGLPSKKNQGYMVNSVVIEGDAGVILIDSGSTDQVGRHILKHVATITPKPVTHVINTHHHGDHVLGNGAFEGAEIISSEQCRSLVERTGYEWLEIMESMIGAKFPNTVPIPASMTFAEGLRTERLIQGVRLVFWVPKGSHTPGDLMVFLPEEGILVAGDIMVNQTVPVMMDASIRNWIDTLQEIAALEAKTIVPGHGPLMTTKDVGTLHRTLADFYAAVERGYKLGLADHDIRKTLDLRAWEKMNNFEAMGSNINRAYLEAEAASF